MYGIGELAPGQIRRRINPVRSNWTAYIKGKIETP
jgi:hypothetical protein